MSEQQQNVPPQKERQVSWSDMEHFISIGLWLLPFILYVILMVKFIPGPNWHGILSVTAYVVATFLLPQSVRALSPSFALTMILMRSQLFDNGYSAV